MRSPPPQPSAYIVSRIDKFMAELQARRSRHAGLQLLLGCSAAHCRCTAACAFPAGLHVAGVLIKQEERGAGQSAHCCAGVPKLRWTVLQAWRPGMSRADLGPVASKASVDAAEAAAACAPEQAPSLAAAPGAQRLLCWS